MDGKKRKNRKKKCNQNKIADDSVSIAEEVAVVDRDHGFASEKNHCVQIPGDVNAQIVGVPELDIDEAKHNHGAQILGNADFQSIAPLESGTEPGRNKIYEVKHVELQEEIRGLEDEKSLWLQKETCLEEKLSLLQNELMSYAQKEANLEEAFKEIKIINDSMVRKQAILEDKVRDIGGVENSWNLKEMSIEDMITRLDEAKVELQMQVKELNESRDSLIQANKELMERVPLLELRIQRLETDVSFSRSSLVKITEPFPEEKKVLYQMEAAHEPKRNLDAENSEFERVVNGFSDEQPFPEEKKVLYQLEAVDASAEKLDAESTEFDSVVNGLPNEQVNGLHIEPDQNVVVVEPSSIDHVMAPDGAAASSGYTSEHGDKFQSLVMIHDTFSTHNGTNEFGASRGALGLDESRISEEIVSVPLDDIQVQETDNTQIMMSGEESTLPLSDAPLIGAPFRLISFVAKYVSGADLVDKKTSKSRF